MPVIVDDFFGKQYLPCEQCPDCIYWEYEDDGIGLSLDRIKNDKEYSASNCHWLSKSEHGIKSNVERKNV